MQDETKTAGTLVLPIVVILFFIILIVLGLYFTIFGRQEIRSPYDYMNSTATKPTQQRQQSTTADQDLNAAASVDNTADYQAIDNEFRY